ncbi:MAG: GNAT family N-acetyltransferase [Candidatus Cybelea sp.]
MRSIHNSALRVEAVSEATRRPALDFLARSPYLNVFISHFLLNDFAPAARQNIFIVFGDNGISAVAYCGRPVVLSGEPDAVAPLAAHLTFHRSSRMIVGPRDTVRAFWKLVGDRLGRPRVVRDRQLVMMVDRGRLHRGEARVTVRRAEMGDWMAIADGSASMIRHELEYDPRRDSPSFDSSVRRMIDAKRWWVGVADDRLCFMCNIGPWSEQTAQLQGIWTPPELRGRGLATASLAAICDRLLEVSPTLSLYVNDFNAEAVALYHRVGFEHVGDFQTILF